MSRRAVSRHVLVSAFAASVLTGCGEITPPPAEPERSPVHVALAAPELAGVSLTVDGNLEAVLDPLVHVTRSLTVGPHDFELTWEGGSASAAVDVGEVEEYAVVLTVDDGEPYVGVYEHPGFSTIRLTVVNAVPDRDLEIQASRRGTYTRMTLAFGESARTDIGAGTLVVSARDADGGDFVDFGFVTVEDRPLFVVVAAHPDEEGALALTSF